VDQTSTETNQVVQADLRTVEAGLKVLWDRVKRASETIGKLREEKSALAAQFERLELELSSARSELARKEELIKTLSEQSNVAERSAFGSNGEREALASRVKELLAKLNSYL